jgi:tRNA A37 threonylcarbamoyltransferase TsaD
VKSLIIAGGVIANKHLREAFEKLVRDENQSKNTNTDDEKLALYVPPTGLSGDNAVMIALSGYIHALKNTVANTENLRASGNLRL